MNATRGPFSFSFQKLMVGAFSKKKNLWYLCFMVFSLINADKLNFEKWLSIVF